VPARQLFLVVQNLSLRGRPCQPHNRVRLQTYDPANDYLPVRLGPATPQTQCLYALMITDALSKRTMDCWCSSPTPEWRRRSCSASSAPAVGIDEAGSASGVLQAVQQIASAVGVAALGTIFFSAARRGKDVCRASPWLSERRERPIRAFGFGSDVVAEAQAWVLAVVATPRRSRDFLSHPLAVVE
jgi:hypothetical protein